jgi:hypothetical protein
VPRRIARFFRSAVDNALGRRELGFMGWVDGLVAGWWDGGICM